MDLSMTTKQYSTPEEIAIYDDDAHDAMYIKVLAVPELAQRTSTAEHVDQCTCLECRSTCRHKHYDVRD